MKICVVTPWYPDRVHAFAGIFVRQQVEALRAAGATVEVEVAMTHPSPPGRRVRLALKAMDRLASNDPSSVFGNDPRLSFVPTLEAPAIGYAGRAEAFRRSLEIKRRHRPIDADVVHAHVALPGGHAALGVGDSRPVVVTEHFTGLARVVNQSDAASMYRSVIERSSHFALVSDSLRTVLRERFKDLDRRLSLTPNIVDLREIPFRDRTEVGNRWLYVGNLTETKNVKLLLRSFSRYRSSDHSATLTIVGRGPLQEWIEQFVERRNLSGSVTLTGPIDHAQLGPYFDAANVLVHLSLIETFGISTMEAIGAGMPVVNVDNGAAREVWGEVEEAVGRILPAEAGEEDVCEAVAELRRSSSRDAAAGRSFVEKRYSPTTVAQQLLEVYRSVV